MAYQQGTTEYATAITYLMAQKDKDTTEWKAARSIKSIEKKKLLLDIFTPQRLFLMLERFLQLM
ncbi:hypothetical protein AB3A32_003365 [Vibrio alginolyticus]|nr:hypothetical protein [Vibrio alginolyticus]